MLERTGQTGAGRTMAHSVTSLANEWRSAKFCRLRDWSILRGRGVRICDARLCGVKSLNLTTGLRPPGFQTPTYSKSANVWATLILKPLLRNFVPLTLPWGIDPLSGHSECHRISGMIFRRRKLSDGPNYPVLRTGTLPEKKHAAPARRARQADQVFRKDTETDLRRSDGREIILAVPHFSIHFDRLLQFPRPSITSTSRTAKRKSPTLPR